MDAVPKFQGFINRLLFRQLRADRCFKKLLLCIEEGATDIFLKTLLNLMSLVICLDPSFRRNINNFKAKYVFKDKPSMVYIVAEFKNNKLKIHKKRVENSELTLIFKDGESLFKLLLSDAPDILNAVLNQEVDFYGNINHLNKFAYMAMHLKLMASAKRFSKAVKYTA